MDTHRDEQVLQLRPDIPSIDLNRAVSEAERFQNQTVRPIVKFQHDLLLKVFQANFDSKKKSLEGLSSDEKSELIYLTIQKDRKLASGLTSLVVALFTGIEFKTYLTIKSEISKRIIQIIKERIASVYLANH